MTDATYDVVPAAAQGLPKEVLDSAVLGASALDARALTGEGRNVLAHALAQLARDGWLRTDHGPSATPAQEAAWAAAGVRAADAYDLGIKAAALVEFADQLAKASTLTPDSAAACARLLADQYEEQAESLLHDDPVPTCRVCGCTETTPCAGPCSWVPDPDMGDLCSGCVDAAVLVKMVDLEAGETRTQIVRKGDYSLIISDPCHVEQRQAAGDTHVVTIAGVRRD